MNIFIVNGTGGSGKTTFEKMVKEIAEARLYHVALFSTIDYVKEIAKGIGWKGTKEPKDRRFLSDLKDALIRWNDIPYKKICKDIDIAQSEGIDAIFIDCREPEEIKRFVEDFNAITVLVQRGEFI